MLCFHTILVYETRNNDQLFILIQRLKRNGFNKVRKSAMPVTGQNSWRIKAKQWCLFRDGLLRKSDNKKHTTSRFSTLAGKVVFQSLGYENYGISRISQATTARQSNFVEVWARVQCARLLDKFVSTKLPDTCPYNLDTELASSHHVSFDVHIFNLPC